jgi:hypothetical protein
MDRAKDNRHFNNFKGANSPGWHTGMAMRETETMLECNQQDFVTIQGRGEGGRSKTLP